MRVGSIKLKQLIVILTFPYLAVTASLVLPHRYQANKQNTPKTKKR
jgi:hypothetical protein